MYFLRLASLPKLWNHNFCRAFPYRRNYSQKAINISDPSIQKYFNHLMLENELLLLKEGKSSTDLKRLREIKPLVTVLSQRNCLLTSIESLKEENRREQDEDIKDMIKQESQICRKQIKEVENNLRSALLEPVLTESRILMEITPAEGDYAELFAQELYSLYKSYAAFKDWDVEVAALEESGYGINKASMLIDGVGALELMAFEDGVHHRISKEDRENRISTVDVTVLRRPTEAEMEVPSSELKTENKLVQCDTHMPTYTYVCVTHTPSGLYVMFKDEEQFKKIAMKRLMTLIYANKFNTKPKMERLKTKLSNMFQKAEPIESSEIIRTYDYSRDRVMEHREGEDGQLHQDRLHTFMQGGEELHRLHEGLLRHCHYQALITDIKKFVKDFGKQLKDEVYAG